MKARAVDWTGVGKLVVDSLRGTTGTARICRELGVPRATFYRWRSTFVAGGTARLEAMTRRGAARAESQDLRRRVEHLERERDRLRGENMLLRARIALRLDRRGLRVLGVEERRGLIAVVRASTLGVRRAVRVLGIPRSTFYVWRNEAR